MGIKEQFEKMKENWLMLVLALVVIVFLSGSNGIVGQSLNNIGGSFEKGYADMVDSRVMGYYPETNSDFAPEVEERKIVKSSSLSTETARGEFGEAEERLKNIVTSSGAFLLDERVNRNGEGWRGYYSGYYQLKVNVDKYDSVVAQLKEIGEVQSFSENMDDVTGSYNDLEIEVGVEKERLARYLEMYEDAEIVSDRIDLNDRIFNQERRIKYLEDSLENVDNRIDYSSVSFSMTEERSEWTDIVFVKLSSLIRGFVDNLNSLLSFIFGIIPWAVALLIVWVFWKKFRSQTA
ncbi:DUF4349 domain-containing protein [archaeon]|jgi:hypothetical protein|nr:DUF4349 domain-containing protein [archaeon]MBT6956313.1 DUF4349 domain-containing protein [archaeon]MBT7128124.1 DUF4349 domain-containing protein [archaeon]